MYGPLGRHAASVPRTRPDDLVIQYFLSWRFQGEDDESVEHRRNPGYADRGRPGDGEGDLAAVQDFEIRFQQAPLGRLWDWLSTPVFED
jgi:hypothetical protein